MERRKFIAGGLAVAGAGVLASCSHDKKEEKSVAAPAVHTEEKHEWKMVTTWPKDFPGLGVGANNLARYITEMSGGRITVKVYGGNELVPPLESFDAVSKGTAEMGHGAAYYWHSKTQAVQFFAAVPFGLTAQEMNAWIYYGGGQQIWDEVYADFNLKPFLGGNTGVQMGGWFNREINSASDFQGLVMRMPGLGGKVISELGATPKLLPGGELFTALETGAIDATEWVGPYNDLAFGFYKIAKFYYYPGWHEPGTALETFVNLDAYNKLSPDLQRVVDEAAKAANLDMLSDFMAKNAVSLQALINDHKVQLRKFPDDLLAQLQRVSEDVVSDVSNTDAHSKRAYDSYVKFKRDVRGWSRLSEEGYLSIGSSS